MKFLTHPLCVRFVIPHILTDPHTPLTNGVCEAKNPAFLRVCAAFYIYLTHLRGYFYMERIKTAENRGFLDMLDNTQPNLAVGCVRRPVSGGSPLTKFILAMLRGDLPSRDPHDLAHRFGISPAHAAGYLNLMGGKHG